MDVILWMLNIKLRMFELGVALKLLLSSTIPQEEKTIYRKVGIGDDHHTDFPGIMKTIYWVF